MNGRQQSEFFSFLFLLMNILIAQLSSSISAISHCHRTRNQGPTRLCMMYKESFNMLDQSMTLHPPHLYCRACDNEWSWLFINPSAFNCFSHRHVPKSVSLESSAKYWMVGFWCHDAVHGWSVVRKFSDVKSCIQSTVQPATSVSYAAGDKSQAACKCHETCRPHPVQASNWRIFSHNWQPVWSWEIHSMSRVLASLPKYLQGVDATLRQTSTRRGSLPYAGTFWVEIRVPHVWWSYWWDTYPHHCSARVPHRLL